MSRDNTYKRSAGKSAGEKLTSAPLAIDTSMLRPGMRIAVGLSGGADSVALLRALASRRAEIGLVVHAAHLHHGLRGEEADDDLAFARDLAARLELPFHETCVDVAKEAQADTDRGKAAETIEEAARRLRYDFFCRTARAFPFWRCN